MNGDLSRHWRALIAAAAPGVAGSWLLTTIVSLIGGGGTTALVGGRVETGPGAHQWLLLGLAVGGWVYAVVAVMIVAAGAVTGTPIPVRAALRHAARCWLAAVGVLVLLAVYAIVLLVGVAFLSFGSAWFAVALVVVAAVLLSRFTYALPAAAIDGLPGLPVTTPPGPAARDEPWDPDKPAGSPPIERFTSADALRIGLRLADGYKTGAFFLFVAVVLVAWGQSWLIDRLPARTASPFAVGGVFLAGLVITTAAVVVQGGLLARSRLERTREPLPNSPATRSGWVLGPAAIILAAAIGAGVAAWNPGGVPVLATRTENTFDTAVGAGPDGVLTDRLGGRGDGRYAAVATLPDGRRLGVTYTSHDEGMLAICRADSCETIKTTFAGSGVQWLATSITMTPAGDVVVGALADLKTGRTVVLWVCPGRDCGHARRTEVGTAGDMLLLGDFQSGRPVGPLLIAVGTGPGGVPAVAWSDGRGLVREARCADRSCTAMGEARSLLTPAWPLTITGGEPMTMALGFDPEGLLTAAFVAPAPESGPGVHVRIGVSEPRDRYALAHCSDLACAHVSLRLWQSAPPGSYGPGGWIAYSRTGLPLLVLRRVPDGETEITTVLCARHCF